MASDSFADMDQSLLRARWVLPDIGVDVVERITRKYDLPEFIARFLCVRGVEEDSLDKFLNPTLREHLPDPFSLADMEECAAFLSEAIQSKKSIAIFGDFDVDGATSSALLYRFLKHCGIEAPIYIPDRLTEGYGPNEAALKGLRDQGAEVVVILDCGTTAFDVLAYGRKIGLEIVVIDHHEAEERLPDARYVINPKRKDDGSGMTVLAAVGVTFMVCVAVNNKLREAGFYERAKREEAPLKNWLDLVALGTVCDMVPLTDVNRLLVRQGFRHLNQTDNRGIKALIDVSRIEGPLDAYHLGFILGPRINAGSRVHKSDLGARLLSTEDSREAEDIAWVLHDCNEKRRDLQAQMQAEAIEKVERENLQARPVIIVAGEGWHTGLTGLVAGNLKEKYGKPACVISLMPGEGGREEGRGSARSVPGVHIANALMDARQAGLIENGGGHAMAGGFTLLPERLMDFQEFMERDVQKQLGQGDSAIETQIDAIITAQGVRPEFVKMIDEKLGPFGQEHPEPLFLMRNVRIYGADIVGESHIRLLVGDWEGGARIKAMAFRAVDTALGDAFLKQGRHAFHIAGHLKINRWQGRETAELHIRDAAFAMQAAQDGELSAPKKALS